MIDRAHAEAVTYRIAFAALTFDPDTSAEAGYSIDEDLEWALQPVLDLPPVEFDLVRDLARATIADPTGHRTQLAQLLDRIATGSSADER